MDIFSLKAAQCAAVCASTDDQRPTLTAVVGLDGDTWIATDSYRLAMCHDNGAAFLAPGALVGHVDALYRDESYKAVVPAKALAAYAKRAKVGSHSVNVDGNVGTLSNNADGLTPGSMVETLRFDAIHCEYPNVSRLINSATPELRFMDDSRPAFNAEYLTMFAKMSKFACGKTMASSETSDYAWTFHGGTAESNSKPTYWAAVSGDITMVVLFMPTKASEIARAW